MRVGRNLEPFTVNKFRTMQSGAGHETHRQFVIGLIAGTPAQDAEPNFFKMANDNRVTRVGRFLRKSSLDELPQLWNVLKGEMSLVGPRPERPFFVEQFKHRIPQYMLRHKVKAGITGWAQVNGWRGNTSLEKRIEYDLYYIENWSMTLDIKIIWLTLVRGLFQRSAA